MNICLSKTDTIPCGIANLTNQIKCSMDSNEFINFIAPHDWILYKKSRGIKLDNLLTSKDKKVSEKLEWMQKFTEKKIYLHL